VVFEEAEKPERHPDHISESGSKYWYTSDGVYRQSDHWGICSSCNWLIDTEKRVKWVAYGLATEEEGEKVTGFARWSDFQPVKCFSLSDDDLNFFKQLRG